MSTPLLLLSDRMMGQHIPPFSVSFPLSVSEKDGGMTSKGCYKGSTR